MNKNLKRILMVVYVLALLAMITGATFAYFAIIKVSNVQPRVQAETAQTDWLIFASGEPINIYATEDTFGQDMGNMSEGTTASATLEVSNTELESLYYYDLFIEIEENEFDYTTEENTAELILTVTDPEGNPITEIEGLEYVTVNGVSGFDITNKMGRYYIADNYELRSSSKVEHNWNVEVTFVNLDSDQNENTDKNFDGYLQIGQDEGE